jgi:hypothetical protein
VVRRVVDLGGSGFLDIGSYGRLYPARRDKLSTAQIAYIARTVHHTPEVVVKVLNQGARDLKAVAGHLNYLSRHGELEIETDYGERLKGEGTEQALVEDWDLDLDELRPTLELRVAPHPRPPRLVHKLMFSMPEGTPPDEVLAAVRDFSREEFGALHRYAMVLHTDEPHPHVHVVVKALSEDGKRLNIRKDTLRSWRAEFAHHLREHGVAANATARAARGSVRSHKLDGIHRAAMRGASSHMSRRVREAAQELRLGNPKAEPGKTRLLATRQEVAAGWTAIADQLLIQGEQELAKVVRAFVARMPPPVTEKEALNAALLEKVRTRGIARSLSVGRLSRQDATALPARASGLVNFT